jgi:hypothetical protein
VQPGAESLDTVPWVCFVLGRGACFHVLAVEVLCIEGFLEDSLFVAVDRTGCSHDPGPLAGGSHHDSLR